MPKQGFLIARDRVDDPLPIAVSAKLNQPLADDLVAMRDRFVEIKVDGAKYVPWEDELVASDIGTRDDRWRTAKGIIAREKVPGGDPGLLYQI